MNTTAILWYYKDSLDTLHEIQVFKSEQSAREFLKTATYDKEDLYPKIVTNQRVFVESEHGHLTRI